MGEVVHAQQGAGMFQKRVLGAKKSFQSCSWIMSMVDFLELSFSWELEQLQNYHCSP